MLEFYICAVMAIAALILTIVLSVILLVSKKEKRRQMKKIKTAGVISALTFPLMAAATIYLSQNIIIEPIFYYYIPDLTGLPYEECKIAYSSFIDISAADIVYSSEYPEGTIISQSLESGTYSMPQPYYVFSMQCVVSKGKESDDSE